MDCSDFNAFEDEDIIEPCRACGIFFISSKAVIQPIFTGIKTGENSNGNMHEIVELMNEWNIQVEENDGRPQHLCRSCLSEFKRILNFKRSCLETQDQFVALDYKRAHNGVVIKKEVEPEQTFCGFIYLDTDDEDDIEEDGSRRVCAPLDIPHMPIKLEHTARVPQETSYQPTVEIASQLPQEATFQKVQHLVRLTQQKPKIVETIASLPEEATFSELKPQELASSHGVNSTLFEVSQNESLDSDEDEIIKFTYEDDDRENESVGTLPTPMQETGVFCKLCGHASLTQEKHAEHMSRMHMLKDCECHICGKKFANAHESRLRFHMKWHKLQNHLKCPICGFFCNSKDTLKEHKLAVHTRTKCEFCGKNIKKKQLQVHLNRHLKEHEEELALKLKSMQTEEAIERPARAIQESCLIQCAFCDITFSNAEELQVHVLETHVASAATPPQEPDPEPEINLLYTSAIQSTITTFSTPKQLNTSSTSVTTQYSSNCSMHSDTSPGHDVVLYKCPICPKSFNLKIKLNRHIRQHSKSSI